MTQWIILAKKLAEAETESSNKEKGQDDFDWQELKKAAFGIGSLKPDEFWTLTLVEVLEVIEAVSNEKARQIETEYHRTAWLAMHIMNTQGTLKRPVTIEKLLGKKKKAEKMTTPEREKAFFELVKKFGVIEK